VRKKSEKKDIQRRKREEKGAEKREQKGERNWERRKKDMQAMKHHPQPKHH
jgi:hypothetical protein